MSITDRAQKVLAEIDAALALADKATPGPWEVIDEIVASNRAAIASHSKVSFAHDGEGHFDDMSDQIEPEDAAFIASSRTGWPASLRCLKTAIEMFLLKYANDTNQEDLDCVATICDQWEASK